MIEKLSEHLYEVLNTNTEHTDVTEYIHTVEEYIKSNPEDTKAYSLLAILEFENSFDCDTALLSSLCENKDISAADKAMLKTNIAYLLSDSGDAEQYNQAMILLQEAAESGSPYPQTYYGLSRFYYENKEYDKALHYISKTANMMQNTPIYNEILAACMIKCGQYKNAEKILSGLPSSDYKHYLSAIVAYFKHDYSAVYEHTDKIDINTFENGSIEDLYFAIDDYQKCIEAFEYDSRFTVTLSDEYAYALYKTGNEEKLDKLISDELTLYNENINETTPDDYEDIEDFNDFIECCKENIKYLSEFKTRITDGCKPEISFFIPFPDYCFYIGCPRHLKRWKIT